MKLRVSGGDLKETHLRRTGGRGFVRDLMWHIKMARSVCGSMGSLLSAVEALLSCRVELFLKFMEK